MYTEGLKEEKEEAKTNLKAIKGVELKDSDELMYILNTKFKDLKSGNNIEDTIIIKVSNSI